MSTSQQTAKPIAGYSFEDRERVGRLEVEVENLRGDLHGLQRDVRDGFATTTIAIQNLANSFATNNQTNWGVVLTGISAVIILLGMASTAVGLYVTNIVKPAEIGIANVKESHEKIERSVKDHAIDMRLLINEELDEFDAMMRERLSAIDQRVTSVDRTELIVQMRERLAALEAAKGFCQK